MGVLDNLAFLRKKARPVGGKLEQGREAAGPMFQRQTLVKGGILFTLVLLTLLAFPKVQLYQYTVQVGEVWHRDALEAPFSFAVYKNPDSLEAQRDDVRRRTLPYFRELSDTREQMASYRDTVAEQLRQIFQAYGSYVYNNSRGRIQAARQDSGRYMQLRNTARPKLTPRQWRFLAEDYVTQMPALGSTTQRQAAESPQYQVLLNEAWQMAVQLVNTGVMNVSLDSVYTERIIIRDEAQNTERVVDAQYLYGINEVYSFAQDQFAVQFTESPLQASIATFLFRSIFQPSLYYMRGETMQRWQRIASRISPTVGKVSEGTSIVDQGQVITPDIKRELVSMERAYQARSGRTLLWKRTLGQFMLVLATFFMFFLYLFLLRRKIFDDNYMVLLISILFTIIIALFAISIRISPLVMWAVPIAIISVLLTVMFDSRVGSFGTITLAILGAIMLNYDFEFFFASTFAGILGVFSVRDIKNRGQFFLSGAIVFLGYVTILVATYLVLGPNVESLGADMIYVAVNSFLLIMAYPLLWVFERTFDITTDLTLLELSDTNRPLLKELSMRAPGTFQHSLHVANMSEAAADAIGANALLARVGALYHDIGKMLKPEYFVENQRRDANPHDQLKPRMSALIIASHVKEGLEMGQQYNMPQRVLDFIPMHHGTTRIEYFYQKALEGHKESDPGLLEAEFRYPGPRPNTVETGILMLADSVEAASRSLDEPSHKQLESLIDVLFRARIDDGQLDKCDLTFGQLSEIKAAFLGMISGVRHGRIKYPGQAGGPKSRPGPDGAGSNGRGAARKEQSAASTEEQKRKE